MRSLIITASLCGLLLTIAGALGAHVIAASDPSWNSAILFGFVHTLAALVACAMPANLVWRRIAGWVFLFGVFLFGFGLIARDAARSFSHGGDPLGLLAIGAPVGGLAFMVGWGLLAVGALRSGKTS